jgi:GxxExxY protein
MSSIPPPASLNRRPTAQEVSRGIIGAAIRVHSELGAGLLESAYAACLQFELRREGYNSITQLALPVIYSGVKLDVGYRIDLLVEAWLLSKVKSVDGFPRASCANHHVSQIEWQIPGATYKLQCCSSERWNQEIRERNRVEVVRKNVT